MLFQVADSGVLLADSIHALPEDGAILPSTLWEAQQRATHVFFETDLDRPPGIPASAYLSEHTQLSSLVSSAAYEAASALWEQYGIQLPLKTIKPWFAAVMLASSLTATLGFDYKHGVDRQLWQATSIEKRFVLEGVEAWLAFDAVPQHEQVAYLSMIAETPDVVIGQSKRLFDYWQSSNAGGFEEELTTAKRQFPNMFSSLVNDRNAIWLPAIVDLVQQQTPSLVLVGALHLVGQGSLPDLLTQSGYQVNAV